jgi:hypothetical protein
MCLVEVIIRTDVFVARSGFSDSAKDQVEQNVLLADTCIPSTCFLDLANHMCSCGFSF